MTSKKILKLTALMMSIAWPVLAADMFVFPKNNQTKEQQEQDQFNCYKWAKEQTGFDPNKPVEQAAAPAPQGGPRKRHKAEKQQDAAEQKAAQKHEASLDGYQHAYGACMEGKGYSVK